MKSMIDYVESEKKINESIINSFSLSDELKHVITKKAYKDIVIYATGSSSNAAQSASIFVQTILNIPVYIKEPSLGMNYEQHWNSDTLYIAISQGGHSYSTIELVNTLERNNIEVFVITSDLNSPIAKSGKHIIDIGMGIEEMPYVTAGYTATILILWLLALSIASEKKIISQTTKNQHIVNIKDTIVLADYVIEATRTWFEKNKSELLNKKRYVFIGYGSCYGVAKEAETKFTEILHLPAHGHELEEYMHGPYLGLQKQDALFLLDPSGKLSQRTLLLRQFLNKHMHRTYMVSNQGDRETDDLILNISVDENLSPIIFTIPFHIISYYLSQEKGIDLTKSYYPDFDEITQSKI